MIRDTKEFGIGLALMAGFLVALFAIFSPLFPGETNALEYLDGTFNSISKDSAYYIPAARKTASQHDGTQVVLDFAAGNAQQAARLEKLFAISGARVAVEGSLLKVSGDLGQMLTAILDDADHMFQNDDAAISAKYGFEGKRVLYDWHQALSSMNKELNKQSKFQEAKTLYDVQTKAVEPAYNYFGVKAIPMRNMLGVATMALVGYVLYTIWYGFAILFLFEGWGLKLGH